MTNEQIFAALCAQYADQKHMRLKDAQLIREEETENV